MKGELERNAGGLVRGVVLNIFHDDTTTNRTRGDEDVVLLAFSEPKRPIEADDWHSDQEEVVAWQRMIEE